MDLQMDDMNKTLPINEGRVCYLLLYYAYRIHELAKEELLQESIHAFKEDLGVAIKPMVIDGTSRITFTYPDYCRNDELANRLGEAFEYSINIINGPMGLSNETIPVFAIPIDFLKRIKKVSYKQLLDLEEYRDFGYKQLMFPQLSLGTTTQLLEKVIIDSIGLTPILYRKDHLFNAARYMKISQDNFYIWPGQYDDVYYDPDSSFKSGWEQTQLEIALLNAYKVIESLIGDLPNNDNKLRKRLSLLKINPDLPIGISPSMPLISFLRKMNKARDQSSAHGGLARMPVLVRDMWVYQNCAHYLLQHALSIEKDRSVQNTNK